MYAPGEILGPYLNRKKIDPRTDILIDIGILLGDEETVTLHSPKYPILLGAAREDGNTAYYATYEDNGVFTEVFGASIIDRNVTYSKFTDGAWVAELALLAALQRDAVSKKLTAVA